MDLDAIIEILGRPYSAEILSATTNPKSVRGLSEELDIPIATCYRRIQSMIELDLVELHDRPLSESHRRVKVYRRTVDQIDVSLDDGVSVEITERSVKNQLDNVWRSTLAD